VPKSQTNDAQREKYRAARRDGLDEIFQGIALALMAPFFVDHGYAWAFLLGIAIRSCHLGRDILRRKITLPWLGHEFSDLPRDGRKLVTLAVAALPMLLLGALMLWDGDPMGSAGLGSRLRWILPIYCAAALTPLALIQAVRYGDPFDFIHAALFLESGFVGLFLILFGLPAGKATALQLWGLAAILVVIGLVRVILFRREQTAQARKESHGD
jgi:hypothetical protein